MVSTLGVDGKSLSLVRFGVVNRGVGGTVDHHVVARDCPTHGFGIEDIELASGESRKRTGTEDILEVTPEHAGSAGDENALHD
jgi:hypothetical protein